MRKSIALFLLPALVVLFAGCALSGAPVSPPGGLLFSHYKAPLTVDFDKTKVCDKVGHASTFYLKIPYVSSFVDLSFAWNRCDIDAAAKQGGLGTVHYADYEVFTVLDVFGRFTVHAYGE